MKKENKFTTLSVTKSIKPSLEQIMLKMGKKMTYNEIIEELIIFYEINYPKI